MNQYRVFTRVARQKIEHLISADKLDFYLDPRCVAAIEESKSFFTLQITDRDGNSINVVRLSPQNEVTK